MLRAADEDHLALAVSQGRVMVSRDKDFTRLNARGVKHNGIVFYRQRTSIGDLVRGLLLIYQVLDSAAMEDHMEYL